MSPPAELVPCGDQKPTRELRRRVAGILAAGGLVALPTETVYGIAARADSDRALDALHRLKGRDPARALTWHVHDHGALAGFEELPGLTRRLTERYWPGPLTLVLRGVPPGLERIAREGWTGLRLPAHTATRALLEPLDFPVVASSANAAGEPPLVEAAQVQRAFPADELGLVVDGGRARLAESSGVLRLGRGHFELLRPGILPIEDLRRTAGLRLAFCCTGNTCRSPMAEGLARQALAQGLGGTPAAFGFELCSMGVAAGVGAPASAHAVQVMAQGGIDISAHRSSPAIDSELRELDAVYCMTAAHRQALQLSLPPRRGKYVQLLDPAGRDIADPIGGDLEDYRACADQIRAAIERRLAEWV